MSTETNEYPNDEEPNQDGHPAALLGSYALGTLDPAEMELVTRHVQRCPACRAELAAYDDVVSLLPYAAPVYQVPVILIALTGIVALVYRPASVMVKRLNH